MTRSTPPRPSWRRRSPCVCPPNSAGCVVTYAHGTRTIWWNPTRHVSVDVRGASYQQSAGGTRTAITGKVASVSVGYQTVLVVTSK